MEKYIKINDSIEFNGGWSSDEAIIIINNYTITKSVQVNGAAPIPPLSSGNTLNVNYTMYKSYSAWNQSEAPVHPKNLGISFFEPIAEETIEDVYQYVLSNLTAKNFNAEIIDLTE